MARGYVEDIQPPPARAKCAGQSVRAKFPKRVCCNFKLGAQAMGLLFNFDSKCAQARLLFNFDSKCAQAGLLFFSIVNVHVYVLVFMHMYTCMCMLCTHVWCW